MLASLGAVGASCASPADERPSGRVRLVFKHSPLGGDPRPFHELCDSFERSHPGVEVVPELLPNAAGTIHQYFLTSLEGRATDFDLFLVDVIWVAEFARAGWLADLSEAFPPAEVRRQFLPGPAEAVIIERGTYAVPWFADVGVLLRRTDLVPRAPETYEDLVRFATDGNVKGRAHGYVWQGLQSEALTCNACEAIWGHGGTLTDSAGDLDKSPALTLDTPENRDGLAYLRSLFERGVSPPTVTSMGEEESRRVFQAGGAAFLRNWPYAFAEAEAKGSLVRGRVALSPLPTRSGKPGSGTLGGYQIGVSARLPDHKRAAAMALVGHLTSAEANLMLALSYGRNPARRAVYDDLRLRAGAPGIALLLPAISRARPRPVTPFYPMIAGTLSAELSAAVTGLRSPAEALGRAQKLVDHLVEQTG